ncbi:hypothetical protein [Deinococcus sp. 12RED42]|uniref:hypothetical protein n=1 Tax=Deinococcus sp. 12RED42 TaxID=2745872 RepID=UPI001E64A95C|nr:hypothetical protein [Deinococcus sp. 12RED42]MCD0167440.1 hypothetical protein [Deinococcus sp. 12RED42]
MTLIQLQIPVADPHDLTTGERDALTDQLRRRAARDLPVHVTPEGLRVSVLDCTPDQHRALSAHLDHLRRPGTPRTAQDQQLLAAFGGPQ